MKAASSPPAIPGMVKALALTPAGATVAQVECLLLSGRGKLILTGNLVGEAKDAAQVALSLARVRARGLGINPAEFLNTDIHFHIPQGPAKDGPSVGLAMWVALVSAMIRKPVPGDLIFTGELSLSGKILGVGGLTPKAIAAVEAGISRLCMSSENLAETGGLPPDVKKRLLILPFDHVDVVLSLVFGKVLLKSKKR